MDDVVIQHVKTITNSKYFVFGPAIWGTIVGWNGGCFCRRLPKRRCRRYWLTEFQGRWRCSNSLHWYFWRATWSTIYLHQSKYVTSLVFKIQKPACIHGIFAFVHFTHKMLSTIDTTIATYPICKELYFPTMLV
jgi:hypothetical protein